MSWTDLLAASSQFWPIVQEERQKNNHMLMSNKLRSGFCCCSVAKSWMTLSLHGLQHARLPCPSLSPGVFSVHVHWVQWCYLTISSSAPLLLPPSISPSIRVFSNESTLHIRWPKYWSFSFSISPSNEHSRLISFRMDWLDLLAVQGTLKSLLQLHSSAPELILNFWLPGL